MLRTICCSFLGLILLLVVVSCTKNKLDVNVSDVKVDLVYKDFNTQLFKTDLFSNDELNNLKKSYPDFFPAFIENIISIGSYGSPLLPTQLDRFKTDPYIKEVNEKTHAVYPDFSPYLSDLKKAFKYYKYYFPNKQIPSIITYISGFNYAVVTDSNYLGIGLDMYLGNDCNYYKQLGIPQYKINAMTNKNLVAGAMLGWISTEFEYNQDNTDLISEMVHQGKLMYLLDAVLPFTQDSLKMGYTSNQIEWCKKNEKEVWFFFVDNELLFTKENKEIIKYMGEAPFIQGFPEGSPGRIGHWVGREIVRSYMNNNDVSVAQMMQQDPQLIFKKSKYKP